MKLKNTGITLEVRDKATLLGYLEIRKGGLEWRPGKTGTGNGRRRSWQTLMRFFEQD